MKFLVSTVTAALLTTQVSAQQFIVGLGYADFADGGAIDNVELNLEYHHTPFRVIGKWTLAAGGVVTIDREGDAFIGAGLSGAYRFDEVWFAEFSFMPGLYADGNRRNALGNTLEFRTLIAIGRELTERTALSLALQHKSNGGLSDSNPGVNTVSLRYHYKF